MELGGAFVIEILLVALWMFGVLLLSYGLAWLLKFVWKTEDTVRQKASLVTIGLLDFGGTFLWLASDPGLVTNGEVSPVSLIIKFALYFGTYKFFDEEKELQEQVAPAEHAVVEAPSEAEQAGVGRPPKSPDEKTRGALADTLPRNSAQTIVKVPDNKFRIGLAALVGLGVIGGGTLLIYELTPAKSETKPVMDAALSAEQQPSTEKREANDQNSLSMEVFFDGVIPELATECAEFLTEEAGQPAQYNGKMLSYSGAVERLGALDCRLLQKELVSSKPEEQVLYFVAEYSCAELAIMKRFGVRRSLGAARRVIQRNEKLMMFLQETNLEQDERYLESEGQLIHAKDFQRKFERVDSSLEKAAEIKICNLDKWK